MLKKILENSRFLVLIAVIGSLIGTVALLILGIYEIVEIILEVSHGSIESKKIVLGLIEIIDTFLMATVFLIISIGLYELFIDSTLKLPEWLEINSLDDLKAKLVGVVVIVLSVIFLGNTANWKGGQEILYLGGGIAAVIFALTYFLKQKK
ncbi:MAG: YqhA family protein [Pyrinomonadaceae bacterium]|nr:YqhA family protein [Pyrinomonadaceae bacterium]